MQKNITHGSLFSGIGGFDLAAEWMGWENVFHCEWNEFGKKILKYYWPNAISYEDITQTDFTIHRGKIDILTGGFPCQPYSTAGKRLGTEDDRHLWPEMLRAIREIKPRFIVAENVSGIVSWNGGLVFHEVQTDMENEGYEVQAIILPAAAVNAPHRRDRVWFVAHAYECTEGLGITANTDSHGHELWKHRENRYKESKSKKEKRKRKWIWENTWRNGKLGHATHTTSTRSQKQGEPYKSVNTEKNERRKASWAGDDDRWPTESPICSGNDGVPTGLDGITFPKWRNESIKGYGNAIVPQIAYQIYKSLMITENKLNSKNETNI
jgi:DNA (cytosine-5)-methyltransferase 1